MANSRWAAIVCLHAVCWSGLWAEAYVDCQSGFVPLLHSDGVEYCFRCEPGTVDFQWTVRVEDQWGTFIVQTGPFCVCPPGTYALWTSGVMVEKRFRDRPEGFTHAMECAPCPEGHFCAGGLTTHTLTNDRHAKAEPCSPCPIGSATHAQYWGDERDLAEGECPRLGATKDSQCRLCDAGLFYSDTESATEGCKRCRRYDECPLGQYSDNHEVRQCEAHKDMQCAGCPLGKYGIPYTQWIGGSYVVPWDEFGFFTTTERNNCRGCPDGTYSIGTGATSCGSCREPNGRLVYSDHSAQSPAPVAQYCLCSPGSYIDTPAGNCRPCPKGTYSQDTRTYAEPCTACIGASVASQEGSLYCTGCPNGVPTQQKDRCVCNPGAPRPKVCGASLTRVWPLTRSHPL